jgi:hypothetical protein
VQAAKQALDLIAVTRLALLKSGSKQAHGGTKELKVSARPHGS